MKLYLRTKSVLDERETLEMYRIEHRGLWGMYTLLCASVVVQLLFGADAAQLAGEVFVIAVTSVALIVAYARRGIWDAHARPSARGNAVYSALSSLGVAVIVLGRRGSLAWAVGAGAAMFALCFLLLTLLMAYVQRRQEQESRELEDD
ncbi:MAG: hypothetical protein PUH70_09425 [Clostridiales bacterium]|nr:hypothetical protein [Clostridiales bacterium]MDY5515987.1 DUF6773 family protein [Candidatus Ventricola sp.]